MSRKSRRESTSTVSGSERDKRPGSRLGVKRIPKTRDARAAPEVFAGDTAEGQNVEGALAPSEACFALFMDHLQGIAFLKDLHGHYVYVSSGFVKLTGRAPGLCVGSSDEEYWPESAERLRAEDQYVIETGYPLTAEEFRTIGGETRHYETVKFPIPDKHGTTVLVGGISIDITHRKVQEEIRKVLLARLANAQEEERRRISRELHDDLTQRLAAMAMDLDRILVQGPSHLRDSLRSLEHRMVQAAEAARHIAHELHPSELDDLTLVAVLRSYCQEFARREGVAVEFKSRKVPLELRREIGSCLFRVAQESLSNIAKHAGANRVLVILEGTGKLIRLRVKDWGIGFTVACQKNKVGLGLLGMEERIGLLNGNFTVCSMPGKGTRVTAEIPLEA
jgi:PAS domain S-box-containing protein